MSWHDGWATRVKTSMMHNKRAMAHCRIEIMPREFIINIKMIVIVVVVVTMVILAAGDEGCCVCSTFVLIFLKLQYKQ